MLTPLDTCCHHLLVSRDVPMTNITEGPCGKWMSLIRGGGEGYRGF